MARKSKPALSLDTLDNLTRKATAFERWADLWESVSRGWVPTLNHRILAQRQLGYVLESFNRRVHWTGLRR